MPSFSQRDMVGSTFEQVDLSVSDFDEVRLRGATIRNADLSELRVRSAWLDGARLTGVEAPRLELYGDFGTLLVNGVDVVPLVDAELNRRMPERALMSPTDVAGFRTAFETLDRMWAGTVENARRMP